MPETQGKRFQQDDTWLIKAYNNPDFLNSPAARSIRILSEMIEPAERLRRHHIRNTVVFFGSARAAHPSITRKKLKTIQDQIRQSKSPSPQLKKDLHRAQRAVDMSRYYRDAAELSRRLTLWFQEPQNASQNFVICHGCRPLTSAYIRSMPLASSRKKSRTTLSTFL